MTAADAAYVDLHCHLDLYRDHARAVADAEQQGVHTLSVTTTPLAWPRNYELTEGTRFIRAALGLHPQLVAERAGELPIWERYTPQTRFIGEVGLDGGPRYRRSLPDQRRVFERILRVCAEQNNKILSVHSVRTAGLVLDMIESALLHSHSRVILHWFSGSIVEARRAAALGCYFSINAAMLSSPRQRVIVASLPRERLLTETDGPFTRVGDRPSVPGDVYQVVEELGLLLGDDPTVLRSLIHDNLRRLLGDRV